MTMMTNELFNKKMANAKKDLLLGLLVALITVFLNTVIMITSFHLGINFIFIVLWGIISIISIIYAVCLLVRGLTKFSSIHANVLGETFIFEPVGKYAILNEKYNEKSYEKNDKEFDEKTAAEAKKDINKFVIRLNDDQFYEDFINRFNLYEYDDSNN